MANKSNAQKMFVKENFQIAAVNEPKEYKKLLGALPTNVKFTDKTAQAQHVHLFVRNQKELESYLPRVRKALSRETSFWICYPKLTSAIKSDVNRDTLNAYAKKAGLSGVSMISLNDTWSAMRFKIE